MAKVSKTGKVESVEFSPAKGGLVSHTRIAFKRGGQGGGPAMDREAEMTIHPTIEHAAAHLKTRFGHVFTSHPDAEEASNEE